MGFSDFHGNEEVVRRLREMLARDRFPQAVILAGPAGAGKYTLALMLAKAINCLAPIPVSYTHLDVYKRQVQGTAVFPVPGVHILVRQEARGDQSQIRVH